MVHSESEASDDDDDAFKSLDVAGVTIRFENHVSKKNPAKSYRRFILACPYHAKCEKKRGCGARQTAMLGRFEPHAFLLAWLDHAHTCDGAGEHVPHRPSAKAVADAYMRHHLG